MKKKKIITKEKIMRILKVISLIVVLIILTLILDKKIISENLKDKNWINQNVSIEIDNTLGKNIYKVFKDKNISIYDMNFQTVVKDKIDELITSSKFDYVVIYNPYGTNELSFNVYFKNSGDFNDIKYTIISSDKSINDFSKTLTEKENKSAYQMIGLTAENKNKIEIEISTDNGPKTYNFDIDLSKVKVTGEEKLKVTEGTSENELDSGLYAMLGNDSDEQDYLALYDNEGIIRSEIPIIGYRAHVINLGQYIQGECVDYSFNKVLNLSSFERTLMVAEAMLDIGGVLGHVNNQNGSAILNQSTADNILTAENILSTCQDSTKIFDEFLTQKADKMQISYPDSEVRKTITRICLMMRLSNRTDIQVVENEITNNLDNYRTLIYELNQSGYNNKPAILLYYSPALLSNACGYFKRNNSETPISDALKTCLPFMQNVMIGTRANAKQENGIITVMLRDAAMVASQDPTQLDAFELNVLGENEASVQKRAR